MLGHVGDKIVEQAALAEQRMDAAFYRAGSERSIHAEAFAGRAEQRQQEDRQGVEQQQTVAPLRIADAQDAHAHAETQILGVAEPRLDRPPFGVEVDDLGGARGRIAGGQMPSLLHPLGVDADRRADLVAGGGEFGAAQQARPPFLADPVGGQARLAVRRGHMNVAAKADDVTEAEAFEEFEQFDVAEAAIGQDRHRHALGQDRLQTRQAEVFEGVALVLQFVLVDRQPQSGVARPWRVIRLKASVA